MTAEDIFDFRNQKNIGKDTNYSKLAENLKIHFRKGEIKMFRKTSFGKSKYQSGEVLQKKFQDQYRKEILCKIKSPERGGNAQKKAGICR